PQCLDEYFFERLGGIRRVGASIVDARLTVLANVPSVLECGRFDALPLAAFIPRPACVDLAIFASARRIVEELINQARRRRNTSDHEARFAHAFQCRGSSSG